VNHLLKDVSFQIRPRRPHRPGRRQWRGVNPRSNPPAQCLEPPTSGKVRTSATTSWRDYFAARTSTRYSDPAAIMLDDISGIAPKSRSSSWRSLLGCFMFSGERRLKRAGRPLRRRSATATAWPRCCVAGDMLLLDEPTNHLDLREKDGIGWKHRQIYGTVLFVSHDRYFIDGLATPRFRGGRPSRPHLFPATTRTTSGASPAAGKRSPPPRHQPQAHPPSSVILSEAEGIPAFRTKSRN